jgi:alkylation response protein AidB-like acyl-CoA dehydrogenase
MDARYPPEALAFGAEVRTWIRDNLPDSTDRDTFMSEWTGKLFDGGFVCASWPKEYGGRGLSVVEQVVLNEEFARAKAPMRVSSLGEILVGPTLLQWGTEEQKHEFLPRILKGEIVWCQGFSEPEAGSDLASLQTSAVRSGDDWIIEGTKIWTSEAEDSDYMILLARTDAEVTPRHAGITFFLMPMRQPGVEVIALPQPDGTRGFNRVEIKGARCPDANVVGGIGNGWKVAMTTLGFERGTSAASSYERLKSELDDMIASAKEQRKNRDPIVRQRLAWAWSKVEILRMSSLRILTAVAHDRHTRETAALEVMNKLYWTDYDKAAQNIAIDQLGPAGQILTGQPDDPRRAAVGLGRREPIYRYPVSPLQSSYFFSLSQSIYGGTSEIQRNIVAERVLGLPR